MTTASSNVTTFGVLAVIVVIVICATVLVALDSLASDLYVGAIVAPVVGGLIGFVAGTKGVQQGSAASTAPPPPGA